MKHLIVILFALSLIGCGGGGGGGGNTQVAQLPNTNGDNGGDDNGGDDNGGDDNGGDDNGGDDNGGDDNGGDMPNSNDPRLTVLNNGNQLILVGIDPLSQQKKHQTHNIHFYVDETDVQAEIDEDARFGTTTTRTPINVNNTSWVLRANSNSLLTSAAGNSSVINKNILDMPNNLDIKIGSLPYLYDEDTNSFRYNIPFYLVGGDTLIGLPTGTHKYGGVYNQSTRGAVRINQNGFFDVRTTNRNFTSGYYSDATIQSSRVGHGIISVEANFDNMTGSIDSRRVLYNGETISTNENTHVAWNHSVAVHGNFNIDGTNGSFKGTGKLLWNGHDSRFARPQTNINADTTIFGNFHGTNAESVSGMFYTKPITATYSGSQRTNEFVGGFIAKKQ